MNRLAVFIACLAATAANACLAEEPAFCKSMCASEQGQCRANAQLQPKEERLMPPAPSKNQMARTAAGGLRGYDERALNEDGASFRRLARGSACEAGYQQCTRDCEKQQAVGGADKAGQPKQAG